MIDENSNIRRQRITAGKRNRLLGTIFSMLVLAFSIFVVQNYKVVLNGILAISPVAFERLTVKNEIYFNPDDGKTGQALKNTPSTGGVFAQGQMLFVCAEDRIKAYAPDGSPVWEKNFKAKSPHVVSYADKFVVSDLFSGDIYIVSRDGEVMSSVSKLGKIDSVKVFENRVGLFLEKNNEAIIMDGSLKTISGIKLPIGNMTSWGFSSSLKRISMSILTMQDGELISCLHQFDEKGELISSITVKDAIIYSFNYYKNNLFAITDKGVYSYKMPTGEELRYRNFKRSCVAYDTDGKGSYAVVYAGNDGVDEGFSYDSGMVNVDSLGNEIFIKTKDYGEISSVKIVGNGFAALSDKRLFLISRSGNMNDVKSFEERPLDLLKIDDDHIAVVFKGRVEVIQCSV